MEEYGWSHVWRFHVERLPQIVGFKWPRQHFHLAAPSDATWTEFSRSLQALSYIMYRWRSAQFSCSPNSFHKERGSESSASMQSTQTVSHGSAWQHWYQGHTGSVSLIPKPISLTYKGGLRGGKQCLMTYEMNHIINLQILNSFQWWLNNCEFYFPQ